MLFNSAFDFLWLLNHSFLKKDTQDKIHLQGARCYSYKYSAPGTAGELLYLITLNDSYYLV